jgi:hypothetical protein
LTPYHRKNLGDSLITGSDVNQYDGKFDYLKSNRWHRFKLTFTGDVEISGADITVQKGGIE